MEIKRSQIIKQFSWLKKKNCNSIISANYDGLICASFLNHFLNWELVGYYDLQNIWISEKARTKKTEIIWVDLNILPINGRALGGHIVSINNEIPKGFDSSCNPNILVKLSSNDFKYKYPFSTIIFLLWLYNIEVFEKDESKFALLNADDVWLKYQKYHMNCNLWIKTLKNYNWIKLFNGIDSKTFEKRINNKYYPLFESNKFFNQKGKIISKHYNIQSKQLIINPDWDEDIILNLFDYFAKVLGWTPPNLPIITERIDGIKNKVALKKVRDFGMRNFIKKNKVFSYAITSNRTLSYTIFDNMKKSPIK